MVFNYTAPSVSYDAQVKSRITSIDTKPAVSAFVEALNIWLETNEKEIIGMAMQQAKDHIDEKMEEAEEKAEEKAEEEEAKEEKLEDLKEIKALQEAIIEGTKEAVAEAEARRQENETPELPLDELIKLTQMNTETGKAQKTLDEIKYSMALLEADLKGIEIDEEI